MDLLTQPEAWAALAALVSLEIVLGIDNLVFIAIVCERLPPEQRRKGRTVGLSLALFGRLALLSVLSLLFGLTEPLFTVAEHGVAGRDLILFFGGLFLLWKSTTEIHHMMNPDEASYMEGTAAAASFGGVLVQIAIMDLVFSLDSVITALGMAERIEIMVAAIVLAMIVMLVAARPVGDFVNANPTIKVLALSFLSLIGVLLIAESAHFEVPKQAVYFAMAYALVVELINMRVRRRAPAAG